nr:uncharacterized protein LOC125182429 isoform X1 [Anser cygnoides]
MPAGLRLVSCSDLYFIRQGTPSRFQKDKTGASHAETRGQGKQELSCERVRLVVKRSRHVRADEEAVNLDLGRRGTRHMQVTREKNLLYMEKGFQESSPLCRCPLLPTELCPDFPEEESSAASCAPEAQKLRGEAACSRLTYIHLTASQHLPQGQLLALLGQGTGTQRAGGPGAQPGAAPAPPALTPVGRFLSFPFHTDLALRSPAWGTAARSQPRGELRQAKLSEAER